MGTMYKPQNNGPHTELAATINAGQTSITVTNASVLPEAPNVLTIGTEEDAELVEVQSITGNILTVQRGFNGTTAKAWDAGVWIYRGITAQDIEELQKRAAVAVTYEEMSLTEEQKAQVRTNVGAEKKAVYVQATLLASAWSAGVQTVTVQGVTAESGGDVGLDESISVEAFAAATKAQLMKTGQGAGTITVKAFGEVPVVNIPIIVRVVD